MKSNPNLVPYVVLGFGFFLLILQFVMHAGEYIGSLQPVKHPAHYQFASYDALLHRIVKDGLVDYKTAKQSPLLQAAVDDLRKNSSDHIRNPEEQLAYWINAYNLLIVKTVVDKYPIDSIEQVMRSFSMKNYLVGGTPLSCEQIYRCELLPRLQNEPEALFLICGGSCGYPPLIGHAIAVKTLKADEEKAIHQFVNDTHNVRYDPGMKLLVLSPLLKWNEKLFDQYGLPEGFVNTWLPENKQIDFENDMVTVTYARKFNWRLNDTN